MKKILSFMLTAALLLTMIAIPVSAVSISEEYTESALGNGDYYKFTFGEDDLYNYVPSGTDSEAEVGKATHKGNAFYPYWTTSTAASATAGYKQVVDVDTGVKYDTLELTGATANNTYLFTPLTKDGKPFEMLPGEQYKVTLTMFNPRCNAWGQAFLSAGGSDNKVNGLYVDGIKSNNSTGAITETKTESRLPASNSNGLGAVGGNQYQLNLKDGTYGVAYKNYTCLHKSGIGLESCEHADKSLSAYYSRTII